MMLASIRAFLWRISHLTRRTKSETTLDDELGYHLQMEIEENLRQGMSADEARRRALIALGGEEHVREDYRDVWDFRLLRDVSQDICYAFRQFRHSPGFALAAIFTFAIGIGACTAIFSIVNGVLLKSLPYDRSEELVVPMEQSHGQWTAENFGTGIVQGLREKNTTFQDVGMFKFEAAHLTESGEPERINEACVSASLFDLLHVGAVRGRVFRANEDLLGKERVVVIGNGLWKRRFGADPGVIGRSIRLNDRPYTVLGIMPLDFKFLEQDTDVWVPINVEYGDSPGQLEIGLNALARLKPGVSLKQAEENLNGLLPQLLPKRYLDNSSKRLIRLHDYLVTDVRRPLYLVFGSVVFVLLLVCSNVASLLLTRGEYRQKEIGIRAALGASNSRLLRQALTESILLSLIGGGIGLLIAFWIESTLFRIAPSQIPRLDQIGIDGRVLGFCLALSMFAALLAAVVPAVRSARPDVLAMIQHHRSRSDHRCRSISTRRALVISEVALAFLLLAGAGVMIRSVVRMLNLNLGYDPKNVLTLQMKSLVSFRRGNPAPTRGQQGAFIQQIIERIQNFPDVEAVGATSWLPGEEYALVRIEKMGDAGAGPQAPTRVHSYAVTPGYFRAMGIRLLRGRFLDKRDINGAMPAVVIDDTLAKHFWPGQNPIGHQIVYPAPSEYQITVVGVVQNVRAYGLKSRWIGRAYGPDQIFLPDVQMRSENPLSSIVIRSRADNTTLAAAVRKEALKLDSDQPVSDVRTMESRVAAFTAEPQFYTLLLTAFALVGLILGVVGVYGVTSYWACQRTHEIGIRMALGARAGNVYWLVLRQGLWPILLGEVLGLAGALMLSKTMTSMVFEIATTDPATYLAGFLMLAAVALTACYIPARRATQVDITSALRCD